MTTFPKYVFIVPYRDRHQQKYFFTKYMTSILPQTDNYEIYISHQCDSRPFNRGATKNIGFLSVKHKYPNNYKDIIFIFNDIDLVPFNHLFDYGNNRNGIVKHYYGFTYALGGIVGITGRDFEASNGFPNFWGWGLEDHIFQHRCEKIGLTIDRTTFFPIGHPNILHLFDGISRIVNPQETTNANTKNKSNDGIRSIRNIQFTIDKESLNSGDNRYVIENNSRIFIINITSFYTTTIPNNNTFYSYDLRDPISQITNPKQSNKINF